MIRRHAQRSNTSTRQTESLDYSEVRNKAQKNGEVPQWFVTRTVLGTKPETLVKLLTTAVIGFLTGILAVGLALGTENIIVWKNKVARHIIHDGLPAGVLRASLAHIAFSLALVTLGSVMVQFWAPQAGGAGVSLIIAYLNGSAVPRLLDWRNLLTKWVGTILAVSSNLALGPEAPMVHLGASVAHVTTHSVCVAFRRWHKMQKWLMCCLTWRREVRAEPSDYLPIIATDAQRREFICAGASAGIAAAFGAPIGGVLFSMEETATYWSRKVAWRCFLCSAVAVYTLAQLHPRWKNGILSFHGVADMQNGEWLTQLPFILAVSIGGGLLGALFNWLHGKIFMIRAPRTNHIARMTEVAIIATITVAAMFALAYLLGTCVDVPSWSAKGYGFTFHCPAGTYNDLATMFLSNPDDTIRHIFSLGQLSPKAEVCHANKECYFTLRSLIIMCPSYLVFMSLAAGIAIPGGLFMPSMVVGGSFGGTIGLLLMRALPSWNIQPGVYAMCAATAMLGGVFRASISLVVLLVEGTQSTKFMLGIIIAVICSNWVGDWINSEGVYETDLEHDGSVVFLRPAPPLALYKQAAKDIMAWPVWCMREIESVAFVRKVLTETTHNGFPVVADPQALEQGWYSPEEDCPRKGPLRGLVLRSQLVILLAMQAYCDKEGQPLAVETDEQRRRREYDLDLQMRLIYRLSPFAHMRESILDAHLIGKDNDRTEAVQVEEKAPAEAIDEEASAMEEAAQHRPSDEWSTSYIDLRPYMDIAPTTVRPETPGERTHLLFSSLGLRHLPVVEENSHVAGIVTRKDLDHAAGFGPWRRNKQTADVFAFGTSPDSSHAARLCRNIISTFSFTPPQASPEEQPLLRSSGKSKAEDVLKSSAKDCTRHKLP